MPEQLFAAAARGYLGALIVATAALAAEPDSPRLRELAATSDDPAAIGAFWERVGAEGTPLIEPVEGEPEYRWVTFVFKGGEATQGVQVYGVGGGPDPEDNAMQRLGDSDVWYRTVKRRADLRASYQFLVDPPAERPDPDDEEGFAAFLDKFGPDPLNRYPWGEARSIVELDQAPEQPWIEERPGVEKGEVITHEGFRSRILDNERSISIYLPAGYDAAAAPYPYVLLFDASAYLRMVPTPVILDNLIAAGRLAPTVAILVGNAEGARGSELPCNDDFAEFLAQELLPWAHRQYNLSRDPTRNVVAGSSYGGLASSFFALRHPELIGNVLSQSGSYWWAPGWSYRDPRPEIEGEWLVRQYAREERRPIRFYLDVGHHEGGADPSMLVVNRHFRNVLEAKGYEVVRFVEFNGGHDYLVWRDTLADGLLALVGLEPGSDPLR